MITNISTNQRKCINNHIYIFSVSLLSIVEMAGLLKTKIKNMSKKGEQ